MPYLLLNAILKSKFYVIQHTTRLKIKSNFAKFMFMFCLPIRTSSKVPHVKLWPLHYIIFTVCPHISNFSVMKKYVKGVWPQLLHLEHLPSFVKCLDFKYLSPKELMCTIIIKIIYIFVEANRFHTPTYVG